MIIIKQAESQKEIEEGVRFYLKFYHQKFSTKPKTIPESLILVLREEGVIGTVGLTKNGAFEIERYFYLDWSVEKKECIEISRLAGDLENWGVLIMAAYFFALNKKARRIIGCMKQIVMDYFRKVYSLPCFEISSRLKTDLPDEDFNFFSEKPSPVVVCTPDLSEWANPIERIKEKFPYRIEIPM